MLFKKGEIDLSKLTGPKFEIQKTEIGSLSLADLLVKTNLFSTKCFFYFINLLLFIIILLL